MKFVDKVKRLFGRSRGGKIILRSGKEIEIPNFPLSDVPIMTSGNFSFDGYDGFTRVDCSEIAGWVVYGENVSAFFKYLEKDQIASGMEPVPMHKIEEIA